MQIWWPPTMYLPAIPQQDGHAPGRRSACNMLHDMYTNVHVLQHKNTPEQLGPMVSLPLQMSGI